MGQAKQRGTFEQRKVEGEVKLAKELAMRVEIQQRRPSPKSKQLITAMLLLASAGLNR